MPSSANTALSLDAQYAAYSRNRFLAMPVTGTIIWIAIGICGWLLPASLIVAAWYLWPEHRFVTIPAIVVGAYIVSILALQRRWMVLRTTTA